MKKTHLIILDGYGLGSHDKGDTPFLANTPLLKQIFAEEKIAKLKTDGSSVGLPEFQTGGSEVGHITIGAGRPIKQLLTKINDQIETGEFFENAKLKNLFKKAKKNNRIHFLGLISDGGIHSFLPHLFGLQKMAQKYKIQEIFIHAFLDGRDVGELTAKEYLEQIEAQNIGTIASIGGRFFGMDRDTNWDREKKHYDILVHPETAEKNKPYAKLIDEFYTTSQESDYYFPPVLKTKNGQIQNKDIVINFNYRTDRMRQFSEILCDETFSNFDRPVKINPENYGIFGPYYDGAQEIFAFNEEKIKNTLGEIIALHGGTQLRISETEKFNHVTFFFSGEKKDEFQNETRILVPSPKCSSYAEKPEMAAREQTEKLLKKIKNKDFNLIVQNFANGDLVGHSGKIEATIKAVETLEECLQKIIPKMLEKNYTILITADHGNCDEMFTKNGEPNASHSKNLVPFTILSNKTEIKLNTSGTLADIAPTILEILELPIPAEMMGKSLIKKETL